jgi:hypothetical protein
MYIEYLKFDIPLITKTKLLNFISTIIDLILNLFNSLIEDFLIKSKSHLLTSFHIFCLNIFSHEICQFKKCFGSLLTFYIKDIFYNKVAYKFDAYGQKEKIIFNYFAVNKLKEIGLIDDCRNNSELSFSECLHNVMKNKLSKLDKVCYIISEILQSVNH